MTLTRRILLSLLAMALLWVVPAMADEQVFHITFWNYMGRQEAYVRQHEIDCHYTGGNFRFIQIGEMTGWTYEFPYPLECLSVQRMDPIPGQVGESEFGTQCDRYAPIFQDLWNEDYGPWDSTYCHRMPLEVPLRVAAFIELGGAIDSLNTHRQEMQNLPEEERVLDPYNGASAGDPNNPLGSAIWGPGGGAAFSWNGGYYRAFQPWLSETYYIVGSIGKVWRVPPEVITATSKAEYAIPLPMNWQEVWEVPLTTSFDENYRPPRGENAYPERPLYKHPRAYSGQIEWLQKYGRGNWQQIAANLTSVDGEISREMFALTFDTVLFDFEDVPDDEEFPIPVVMFNNIQGYIITVNGREPEIVVQDESWMAIKFNYGTDQLVLSNGLQPIFSLNGLVPTMGHSYYVIPLVSWVNEGVFVSGDWAGIEAVQPVWFDSEPTELPTSKWSIRLLGYQYLPFTHQQNQA